jgi:hypothetical protein
MVYETLGRLETLGMTTMIEHVVWILIALIVFFVVNMLTGITGIICGCLRYPLKRLLFLKPPPERPREDIKKKGKKKEERTESEDDEKSEAKGQESSAVQDEEDAEGQ